ncbi:MAG: hypothetical protein ACTSUJ_04065 [Candidatus Njordarchaeales archaeon]
MNEVIMYLTVSLASMAAAFIINSISDKILSQLRERKLREANSLYDDTSDDEWLSLVKQLTKKGKYEQAFRAAISVLNEKLKKTFRGRKITLNSLKHFIEILEDKKLEKLFEEFSRSASKFKKGQKMSRRDVKVATKFVKELIRVLKNSTDIGKSWNE